MDSGCFVSPELAKAIDLFFAREQTLYEFKLQHGFNFCQFVYLSVLALWFSSKLISSFLHVLIWVGFSPMELNAPKGSRNFGTQVKRELGQTIRTHSCN